MRVQRRRDRRIETSSGKKPRRRRKRAARRGRITTAEKVAQAERTERVFPEDVSQRACRSSHTRPVWRLEHGRAVLVAYEVHRGPGNRYGVVPGVRGRSPLFEIKKGGIETRVGPRGRVRPRGISTRMSEDAAARAE